MSAIGIGPTELIVVLFNVLIIVGIPLILVYVILQIRQIARSVKRIEEQLQETQLARSSSSPRMSLYLRQR